MKRLTITGWDKFSGELKGEYGIGSVVHTDEEYRITLWHPSKRNRTFVILRKGFLTGGDWHYRTYIELSVGKQNAADVTLPFLRDPQNLIEHINRHINTTIL